ncbi:uncharacterized protein STEHIDRAFT_167887 [Stereum hirsutum FP-91666 SS1]|uniref:uncharacterized protein n=1 Tax=Stereum hirsutum (strain FP-91666) TaxID=721885 RepID=UPI000440E4D3|nr:uncharacterized protein STEHIDRAFT_167887 [Stereum hirsutum FP-91666 SS1]EIM86998.1 hypothetical protein STEHIDRAFT_167887 [Stereum hirsutum FP-91666 SS1]
MHSTNLLTNFLGDFYTNVKPFAGAIVRFLSHLFAPSPLPPPPPLPPPLLPHIYHIARERTSVYETHITNTNTLTHTRRLTPFSNHPSWEIIIHDTTNTVLVDPWEAWEAWEVSEAAVEATRAVSAASLTWSEEGGITGEEDLAEEEEVMATAVVVEDTVAEDQAWAEDLEDMEDMEEDSVVREVDLVVREGLEDIMVVEEDSTDQEVVDLGVQEEDLAEDGRRALYA